MTKYLLDSNVFMTAANGAYGMDFCPAFWEWIERQFLADQVFSIRAVLDEIKADPGAGPNDDTLHKWAWGKGRRLFLAHDQLMVNNFPAVSSWCGSQGYTPAALSQFFSIADYHLVAYSLAHGITLVTHEVKGGAPRQVKIPDVCKGLQVSCISPYDMLRREGARFVL